MTLKHIVLFKFKENISAEKINQYLLELENLQNSIEGILSFKRIKNINDNLAQGFQHGFEMEFENEKILKNYLNHERHEELSNKIIQDIKDFPEGLFVCDFYT